MTLDEINADITAYHSARDAILNRGAASYTVGGRSLTSLDLRFIEERLTLLRQARDRAANGLFLAAQNRRPE